MAETLSPNNYYLYDNKNIRINAHRIIKYMKLFNQLLNAKSNKHLIPITFSYINAEYCVHPGPTITVVLLLQERKRFKVQTTSPCDIISSV